MNCSPAVPALARDAMVARPRLCARFAAFVGEGLAGDTYPVYLELLGHAPAPWQATLVLTDAEGVEQRVRMRPFWEEIGKSVFFADIVPGAEGTILCRAEASCGEFRIDAEAQALAVTGPAQL